MLLFLGFLSRNISKNPTTEIARERETKNRFLSLLSRETFGIYVLHVFVLDLLIGLVIPYTVFWEQLPLLYILIVFILDFGLTLLLSRGLSKIRGVRKLVRG